MSLSSANKSEMEYHRLSASLAKSLSLPTTTTASSTLKTMWEDKQSQKNLTKYKVGAALLFLLLIMTATFLFLYRIYIRPTNIRNQSSKNTYPISNATLFLTQKYINEQTYTFSYQKTQYKSAEIYGILVFIHFGNHTLQNLEIEFSLDNNTGLQSCFKKTKLISSLPYITAECDTQTPLFHYQTTFFKLSIDITDNAYYHLQIYYLLLSPFNIDYRYRISPFVKYEHHSYPVSRSYYFGMSKKQITDGTYAMDFVFTTLCQNNSVSLQQCRIGDGDESSVMFPNYFTRSDSDKQMYCDDSYCDQSGKSYRHTMELSGGFNLMYLQDSGFWIVLQYAFADSSVSEYEPFIVELYAEKKASYWKSGEFVWGIVCVCVAICVVVVLVGAIRKQRKMTKYTSMDRKLCKRFYLERDEILESWFGKDIACIVREYLDALECIQGIRDECIWKGKQKLHKKNTDKKLEIN